MSFMSLMIVSLRFDLGVMLVRLASLARFRTCEPARSDRASGFGVGDALLSPFLAGDSGLSLVSGSFEGVGWMSPTCVEALFPTDSPLSWITTRPSSAESISGEGATSPFVLDSLLPCRLGVSGPSAWFTT